MKDFGGKSKSVTNNFKRACRALNAYLEENKLEFSLKNGQKWLSEIHPKEQATRYQRTEYFARQRAVFLLFECKGGRLVSWRSYLNQKSAIQPKMAEYKHLLYIYTRKLQEKNLAKSTIVLSMRAASDFFIYLEANGKHEIECVMPRDVTGYFAQESFNGRKPGGLKAYAYKLKSFLEFLEDTGL